MTVPVLENRTIKTIKEDGYVTTYYGSRTKEPVDIMFIDGLPEVFKDEIDKYGGVSEYLYDFKNATRVGSRCWDVCHHHKVNVFTNTDIKSSNCLIKGDGNFEYVLMFRHKLNI